MTGGINMTKDIIPTPVLNKTATGYTVYWLEHEYQDIAMGISRIKENNRNSSIECEIEVAVNGARYEKEDYISLITSVRTNLLSISARNTLVKTIKDSCINDDLLFYDWGQIVNKVSSMVVRDIRKSDPVIYLDGEYGNEPPEYLIYPLLLKDAPNIFYAERSSAKTLFANLLSIVLTLPYHDNKLGMEISEETSHNVLLLDWESNKQIAGWQKECLVRGLNIGYCGHYYLQCYRPIYEIVDNILVAIEHYKADVVIIDSLGMAVGDDLNLTAPAFLFWGAIRQLPVTPIILAHTSKDINTKRKTVYGNAYYEAEARSIWELSKRQEIGSNELNLTLYNRKSPPFKPIHESLGYRFIFDDRNTYVEKSEPESDKRVVNTEPTDSDVVLSILMDSERPMTLKEIRELSKPIKNLSNLSQTMERLIENQKVLKNERGYSMKIKI